jgi:hypothetical protein
MTDPKSRYMARLAAGTYEFQDTTYYNLLHGAHMNDRGVGDYGAEYEDLRDLFDGFRHHCGP